MASRYYAYDSEQPEPAAGLADADVPALSREGYPNGDNRQSGNDRDDYDSGSSSCKNCDSNCLTCSAYYIFIFHFRIDIFHIYTKINLHIY